MHLRALLASCLLVAGLGCSDATDGGSGSPMGALPVCAAFVDTEASLPTLSPKGMPGGRGWGNGPHVYSLVSRTDDGWSLSLDSGTEPAVEAVGDPGALLAGLQAGDRISVDGIALCQSFSGCKSYQVIRNAADGTLIEASYFHDSAIDAFAALLGAGITLEPVCRAAETDSCYPGAVVAENQLRFAGNPAPVAAGTTGSIVLGGQTLRVAAGSLVTLSGGGPGTCLDAGSFFRGRQSFTVVR